VLDRPIIERRRPSVANRPSLVALLTLAATLTVLPTGPADAEQSGPAVVVLPGPGGAPAEDYAFNGEEVRRTLADTWHKAGHRGAGQTIALIGAFDGRVWDASAAIHELPASHLAIDAFCHPGPPPFNTCARWIATGARQRPAVAAAEIVHDMAPAAELVVVAASTAEQLEASVPWMVDQGVDVVLRTRVGGFDGPGDGTGPIDEALDAMVDEGMTVVQAVGNEADGGYYRWTYADENADGWVDFAPEVDRLSIPACGSFSSLRWDDFGEGDDATDYDLHVFTAGSSATDGYERSEARQSATVPPVEQTVQCTDGHELGVRVVDAGSGADGDVLELLGAGATYARSTEDGSAAGPGEDSVNPGVVTVGALDPPGATPDPGSSRGPDVVDPATPDLAAPTCLATYSVRSVCSTGTAPSAATVAGAAALYRADNPSAVPADVATWLTDHTVDRGDVGVDNATGHGELLLPSMGPHPRYKPDVRIRATPRSALVGDNRYTANGARQAGTSSGRRGREVAMQVTIENDGNTPERFLVGGSRTAFQFRITYRNGRRDVTDDVTARLYSTEVVQPGRVTYLQIRVRIPSNPRVGGIQGVVQAFSQSTLRQVDAIRFTTVVRV
jgi:hypothetical protein